MDVHKPRNLAGKAFQTLLDAIALRSRGRYTQVPEPTEEYIRLTRLEGIVVSVLCAVLLVVLLFAPT